VLILFSSPGQGKTMLMCGLIDALKRTVLEADLMSYFFCQTSDSRYNNATAVLRSVIHHLVRQRPSLVRHVREEYDRVGAQLFTDTNAWTALSMILTNMLNDNDVRSANVYFIMDAMDECIDQVDRKRLLELIVRVSTELSHTKWIVSSRGWNDIRDVLTEFPQIIHLALDPRVSGLAVNTYIEHKVDALARKKKFGPSDAKTIRDYLKKNAGGTFLWVALVCQRLENSKSISYKKDLQSFPPGLENLYERMLQQVQDLDEELYKFVLGVVLSSHEPPETRLLASLVKELGQDGDRLERMRDITRECGSFLSERDDKVVFVHQSAKDYLLGPGLSVLCSDGLKGLRLRTLERSAEVVVSFLQDTAIEETPNNSYAQDYLWQMCMATWGCVKRDFVPPERIDDEDYPLAYLLGQCHEWIQKSWRRRGQEQLRIIRFFLELLEVVLKVCISHQSMLLSSNGI